MTASLQLDVLIWLPKAIRNQLLPFCIFTLLPPLVEEVLKMHFQNPENDALIQTETLEGAVFQEHAPAGDQSRDSLRTQSLLF